MTDRNGQPTYFEVLTAAITDVSVNGYDSQERADYWAEELRKAAQRGMSSDEEVERLVRDGMSATFFQQVDRGAVLKINPGVSRFTLEQIKPELRAELSRRIAASIDLIKINRAEAIEKAQRRFRGWATSVPSGGAPKTGKAKVDKVDQKDEIRKSLSQLSFIERRVIIDQNAKLVSSINTTVATNGGAIAATWHSHKFQKGYQGRPDHNARDGKVFLVKDSWAHKAGLVKPNVNGYTTDVEQPGELVFCFPPETIINFANGIEKSYRHLFDGELTEFVTSSGKTLRATPNHPILTPNGWVAAGDLQEGDYVIEVADKRLNVAEMNKYNAAPVISDVFATSVHFGNARVTPGSKDQFHGDGFECDVDIVDSALNLEFGTNSFRFQCRKKLSFAFSDHFRAAGGSFDGFLKRRLHSAARLMCRICQSLSPVNAFAQHADFVGFASISDNAACANYTFCDGSTVNIKAPRQGQNAVASIVRHLQFLIGDFQVKPLSWNFLTKIDFAAQMAFPQRARRDRHDRRNFIHRFPFPTQNARVVKVNRIPFASHVFNLQTRDGWYAANGIITHNCRCDWQYLYSLRSLPPDMLTDKGKQALAEARRKVAA